MAIYSSVQDRFDRHKSGTVLDVLGWLATMHMGVGVGVLCIRTIFIWGGLYSCMGQGCVILGPVRFSIQ
jgi:hypothetical protein